MSRGLSVFDFVTKRVSLSEARARVQKRLADRAGTFLRTMQAVVYDHPASPYLQLLRMAGCEPGDLAAMVRRDGVDAALDHLRRSGVYLTYDEFKGRVDVVRGSHTFRFSEGEFDNPLPGAVGSQRTGGSRSAGSIVQLRFDYITHQRAPALWLQLDALKVADAPVVMWKSGLPSGPAMNSLLTLACMRRPLSAWYSLQDPYGPNVTPRTRALLRAFQMAGALTGAPKAFPVYTPAGETARVLEGIDRILRRHGRCVALTTPSAAVRVAAEARARGRSLDGLCVVAGSEPLTDGKHADVVASGARIGSHYIATEVGSIASACGDPAAADDVHLLEDSFALLLHRREWPLIGETDAFMLTTLLPVSPKILLNVELDDLGVVTRRRCGCAYGEMGFDTHLHEIRSFTKMSGEGNTLWRSNCVHVIEEILPKEFGGHSIDYQLLEAEDDGNLTRMFLVVNPALGPIDEARVLARFKEAVWGIGPQGVRVPHVLRQDDSIRLVRRAPVPTARGKLLPFQTLVLSGSMTVKRSLPSQPTANGSGG
jgi:hypothetical protein